MSRASSAPADPAGPAASALTGAPLVAAVRSALAEVLAARRAELSRIAPEAAALVDRLSEHLEGGKLLRPRFCAAGGLAVATGEAEDRERLLRLGAAIELVQATALIHDDVIDHSPTRRGRPAVHTAAAAEHRALGLTGDPEDHGVALAIVLGDLALTWAHAMAQDAVAGAAPTDRDAAIAEFDALCTEVTAGQYLDVLHQAGGYLSRPDPEDAARAVTRWKTIPYTVLRPVRMGAALMGASAAQLEVLSEYALLIGEAFQLRDDLLGAVGQEERTGKSGTGDITEGKRTVLLAIAQSRADAAQRQVLEHTVGNPRASAERIAQVQQIFAQTGAITAVTERIRAAAPSALSLLQDAADLTPGGRAALRDLALAATDLTGL